MANHKEFVYRMKQKKSVTNSVAIVLKQYTRFVPS